MITKFDPTTTAFQFNSRYSLSQENEASTYQELMIEGIWKHGTDIVYIDRNIDSYEPALKETLSERLSRGTKLRFFVEETTNWGGQGDLFSKFGIRVTDEMICYCPKELFKRTRPTENWFPKPGDIVLHVPANKLFEISLVEDEVEPSFYLFGNRVMYKFTCKPFSYEHVEVDQSPSNGIPTQVKALDIPKTNEGDIERNVTPWKEQDSLNSIIDRTEEDPLG